MHMSGVSIRHDFARFICPAAVAVTASVTTRLPGNASLLGIPISAVWPTSGPVRVVSLPCQPRPIATHLFAISCAVHTTAVHPPNVTREYWRKSPLTRDMTWQARLLALLLQSDRITTARAGRRPPSLAEPLPNGKPAAYAESAAHICTKRRSRIEFSHGKYGNCGWNANHKHNLTALM